MVWFGFGFNYFGQICKTVNGSEENRQSAVKVTVPVRLDVRDCGWTPGDGAARGGAREQLGDIRTSWSRTADLRLRGEGRVFLRGFGASAQAARFRGCRDAQLTERHLTLAFGDRAECWSLDTCADLPVWTMEYSDGPPSALPLLSGGYVTTNPPIFRPLSPELCAVSLALGLEHAVLLTASGSVYTWGLGSHGQLGHGELEREEEPRVVEALWGVAMAQVAAGGWHSATISTGGDLYMWGWNESGQLGMPARGLQGEKLNTDQNQGTGSETEGGDDSRGVFISIQAFPALVDLPEDAEVTVVSCGSRHTAAVTGDYGQLGHGGSCSSDRPLRVDFFSRHGLFVLDVVCGPWNTFVSAVEKEEEQS
ncbi:RCC1 domain-containing protein 1 isoform X2 [Arapaima gigas]